MWYFTHIALMAARTREVGARAVDCYGSMIFEISFDVTECFAFK